MSAGKGRKVAVYLLAAGVLLAGFAGFLLQRRQAPRYEKGVVLVSFNEGISYGEARTLFSELGLEVLEGPPLWRFEGFEPTDETELRPVDAFKLRVPDGREETISRQLLQSPIVRSASLNHYLKIKE